MSDETTMVLGDELNEALAHYGRALDEIYRLRTALAYEAHLLGGHLSMATFPKTRRASAEAAVRRMNLSAMGKAEDAYAGVERYWLRMAQNNLGIATLTRAQFEAEALPEELHDGGEARHAREEDPDV